jgi:hypothetical protein
VQTNLLTGDAAAPRPAPAQPTLTAAIRHAFADVKNIAMIWVLPASGAAPATVVDVAVEIDDEGLAAAAPVRWAVWLSDLLERRVPPSVFDVTILNAAQAERRDLVSNTWHAVRPLRRRAEDEPASAGATGQAAV